MELFGEFDAKRAIEKLQDQISELKKQNSDLTHRVEDLERHNNNLANMISSTHVF